MWGKRYWSKYLSRSQNGYNVLNGYNIFFNLSDHLTPAIKQELKQSTAAKYLVALEQKQLQS